MSNERPSPEKTEGLLSAEYRSLGVGPLSVAFCNSSRNPRTLYVKAGQKISRRKLNGFEAVHLLVSAPLEVSARQNYGDGISVSYEVKHG